MMTPSRILIWVCLYYLKFHFYSSDVGVHCVAQVNLNDSSNIALSHLLESAYNPGNPFIHPVPAEIFLTLRNSSLKNNFTAHSPYASATPEFKNGSYFLRAEYCGMHFIDEDVGFIVSDDMVLRIVSESRCTVSFVGSQFCTPSAYCPWFQNKQGNCRTNYVQITDYGESFLLHFCDDFLKPNASRSYTAQNGVLDITIRYTSYVTLPSFLCYVKCVKYAAPISRNLNESEEKQEIKPEVTLPSPRNYPSCKCGEANGRFNRIVGGRETLVNQYPWTLAVMNFDSNLPFCGGSLISDRYVLTAAHCVEDEFEEDLLVILNEHDFFNKSETLGGQIRRKVREIILFPHYLETTFYGDIALLLLDQPVNIKKFILTPICLPHDNKDKFIGKEVIAAGWGTTEDGIFAEKSPKLFEVPLSIISNTACNDYHPHIPPEPPQITDSMMCAGYPLGGRDTCAGDSGGPVFAKLNGSSGYSQLGITSWGYGCALRLNPGVFTRVSSFLFWIRMHTVDGISCSENK